jgi:hypothetical protein
MIDDVDFDILRASAAQGRIHWHQHALERFFERGISRVEIVSAIMNGEIIEAYPTDRPYPSCLILGVEVEPVHVVASVDPVARICHVITAYRPDLEHFGPDFKTRRK